MAARFLAPDLTQLAPADLLEEISFEAILAAQKAWILARWDDVRLTRPDLPPLTTLGLETEPMTIVVESYAYREQIMRALVNDKARAVMLAYSTGHDLDHLGVRFGVVRATLVTAAASATGVAIMESDDRYRRRIQLAPEAFGTAGARGAYIYHALTYDAVAIEDAWAFSPKDGHVHVVVAGPNGADVSDDILAGLIDRFDQDDIRPLTDAVTLRRAARVNYSVAGTLLIEPGPDADTIEAEAVSAIEAYATKQAHIHATVYWDGLSAAGKVGSAESFALTAPATHVVAKDAEIPHLTSVNLTVQETD